MRFLADVTTTPEAPPQFRALERERFNQRRDMKYPERLAELQRKAYPRLRPLSSALAPVHVFELIQALALEMRGWEIVAVEPQILQLEAAAGPGLPLLSLLSPLRDDIVIQVRPEASGCTVHMRCKARVGGGMLGLQAGKVRRFLARLGAGG